MKTALSKDIRENILTFSLIFEIHIPRLYTVTPKLFEQFGTFYVKMALLKLYRGFLSFLIIGTIASRIWELVK